jgi:hypothetical protein
MCPALERSDTLLCVWSDEALLMVRPFAHYRALSAVDAASSGVWLALRRPLLWLLIFGAFVSFTTAGRWVSVHVLAAGLQWIFVPLYQLVWLLAVVRLTGTKRPVAQLVDLFFAGQGPWLLFALAISGVCIFSPAVWPTFRWMMEHGVLIAIFLVAIAWSALLTFAFFRSALALSTRIAALATFAFYVGFDGTIVAWYLSTGQLYPILGAA